MLPRLAFALSLFVFAAAPGCRCQQTQEGEMPEVKVEGGQVPKYDVDTAKVKVGTEEKTVEVPDVDVDVKTEKKTIDVPDVDVEMPGEQDEAE